MKNILLLSVFIALFGGFAVAQDKAKITDFSGEWTLDLNKSKLGERSPIESMTMSVSQSEKELSVETKTKRKEMPSSERERSQGAPGRGGFGGGMMNNRMQDGKITYNLDGKETTIEGIMGGQASLKVKFDKNGRLKISRTQNFDTPMGPVIVGLKETWELGADGKTLTVKRDMETPRGTQSSEMFFTKQ